MVFVFICLIIVLVCLIVVLRVLLRFGLFSFGVCCF